MSLKAKPATAIIETKPFTLPLLALEPRYVFDAALGADLIDKVLDSSAGTTRDAQDYSSQAADIVAAAASHDGHGDAQDHLDTADSQVNVLVDAVVTAHNLVRTTSEIAFIDSRLEGLPEIVSAIPDGVRIVLIDGSQDAIGQIADAMSTEHDVTGIHIISHGTAGSLLIGSSVLNTQTMSTTYRDQLLSIRGSMAQGADILIYGCDFGAGEEGAAAAQLLSDLTGADVASSIDDTGAQELGGNWDLERHTGSIESASVHAADYKGLLAPLTVTTVGGTLGGSTVTALTLAEKIMGANVTVVSATLGGSNTQAGVFSGATGYSPAWLTFDSGVVFSSGNATSFTATNSSDATSTSVGTPGTSGFNTVGGGTSFDASYIDITFVPTSDRISIQFVFGSDEYNEYVYASVNDAIGIWVNGVNIAVTPTGAPVGIDTINQAATYNPAHGSQTNDPIPGNGVFDSAAPSLYVNNARSGGTSTYSTAMDGFTRTLGATITVTPGVSNTIRIGVADIGDAAYDSWLLVKADSGQANLSAQNDVVGTKINTPIVISPLSNDRDVDNDAITITNIADQAITVGQTINLASGATVQLNANGTLNYTPKAGSTATDLFTYTITDGHGNAATAYVTVNISVNGVAPTVDLDSSGAGTGFTTRYTAGSSAVAISDVDTAVADSDSNISGAAIGISNALAGDKLTVGTLPSGITVSSSSTATNIVLTGSATPAQYALAIQAITYSNTLSSPDPTDRTISVQVTDTTGLSSNIAIATIDINNTPVDGDEAANVIEDTTLTVTAPIRIIVRAFETAAIASEMNARITYLPAREGDKFRKGDLLVEFDCRRSVAEHDAAQASMLELKAVYESQLKLLEYKSTGTVAVEQARQQYDKAQAELRLYAVKLETCRITAPFDGVVTEKLAQMHEVAQPNQPLIKILNQSKIELVMMVPSAWLPRVANATFPVKIDETGEVLQARVLQSTGLIDPVSQTSRVLAELVEPSSSVLPGMSGTADMRSIAR